MPRNMMNDIYVLEPINKTSGAVISQKGCQPNEDLNRDELLERIAYLNEKMKQLKQVLGVNNKRQHKNLMGRFNKKLRRSGNHPKPDALLEYVKTGEEIQKLQKTLKVLKVTG